MVKKKIPIICLLALILFTSVNCYNWQAIQKRNRTNLMKLELDMTKSKVVQIMGTPTLNEAYKTEDEGELVILFYYTNRKWADGNYTKDECIPIVFKNGILIGWGDEFYQNILKVEVEIKKDSK